MFNLDNLHLLQCYSCYSISLCNMTCFSLQNQVPSKFLKGLVRTNGCGKMCCRRHQTRPHLQGRWHFSLHLTVANHRGWSWQKESQWPGATSRWTDFVEQYGEGADLTLPWLLCHCIKFKYYILCTQLYIQMFIIVKLLQKIYSKCFCLFFVIQSFAVICSFLKRHFKKVHSPLV